MAEHSVHCSFCGVEQSPKLPLIAGLDGHICEDCVQLAHQVVSSWGVKRAMAELHGPPPVPEAIKKQLDDYVIGQDLAKEILSIAVYNHYKRLRCESAEATSLGGEPDVELGKSNILLLGPSGSGKTLLASTLARIVGVPFVVADATSLTQAGYVGDDVDTVISRLLDAADGHVGRAEWGIVYIDEIDKLARSPDGATGVRDVSGEGVQQALLKLVEGSEIKVPAKGRRREGGGGDEVSIDTGNILFIVGGAFAGLEEVVAKRVRPKGVRIGFHAELDAGDEKPASSEDVLAEVRPEDLRRFGLIPEFIGRFPVIAPLGPMEEDALVRILTEPKNALVRQYRKLFAVDGVDLTFSDAALHVIAREAIKQGTGARGLRSVLEHTLRRSMFELPARDDVSGCLVEEVEGEELPVVSYTHIPGKPKHRSSDSDQHSSADSLTAAQCGG